MKRSGGWRAADHRPAPRRHRGRLRLRRHWPSGIRWSAGPPGPKPKQPHTSTRRDANKQAWWTPLGRREKPRKTAQREPLLGYLSRLPTANRRDAWICLCTGAEIPPKGLCGQVPHVLGSSIRASLVAQVDRRAGICWTTTSAACQPACASPFAPGFKIVKLFLNSIRTCSPSKRQVTLW